MILTCPSCGTQYVVKDGAIPPGGRQVRCAACKHSWHQDPEDLELDTPIDDGAAPVDSDEESLAEATLIEPRSGPEAEQRAYEESVLGEADAESAPAESDLPVELSDAELPGQIAEQSAAPAGWDTPPEAEAADDSFSPFAAADETEPRRRRPLLTILLIALVIAALAAAFWFLAPPEWKARVGLGAAGVSPLALVTTHMDRQQLESGNELLTVTGRVINPTSKEQDVPAIQAQLRSKAGKVVYSWTIAPPARTLPAGGSASFNSAEVNVPPGGDELTISLGSPRA
ncbi:zinc-ribbon domain-containing protein [Sphingomonas sp. URHD0057]|uniref:zinc-ribbon domain-containing protein n=1 Tax=Sphingomonas sp. URHD0057 TaxID=1380389 RepID=UPI000A60A23C|nr:zinc-ribbon domain-containing protein [Sphingomonas sp. URHD0057]